MIIHNFPTGTMVHGRKLTSAGKRGYFNNLHNGTIHVYSLIEIAELLKQLTIPVPDASIKMTPVIAMVIEQLNYGAPGYVQLTSLTVKISSSSAPVYITTEEAKLLFNMSNEDIAANKQVILDGNTLTNKIITLGNILNRGNKIVSVLA